MPDLDEYRISELDPVLDLSQDDLMEVSVEDDNAESGYVSHKSPLSQLGAFFVNILQYVTSLKTGNKTVTGAINQTVSNFANDYDSTSTYAVDDCVIYGGVLYKCNTAITTAEEWNATHWTQIKAVDVGGGGNLADLGDVNINTATLANGQVIKYDAQNDVWYNAEDEGAASASGISYDPTTSGLSATNAQDAIDELRELDPQVKTASGSIATFSDGGDDIPVSEYECEIVAQQASGTPTSVSPLPITGFDSSIIGVYGKNLFGGSLDGTLFPTKVLSGTQLTASMKSNSGASFRLNYYRADRTLIDYWGISESTGFQRTFTTTEDTYYFAIVNVNGTVEEIQVEKSSSKTTYEAYKGNLYTVAFGQTIYGGRLIYKNGEWAIEATHGYVDLGDLDWSYTSGTNSHMSAPLSGGKIIANSVFFNGMCSIYKTTSLNGIYLHTIDKTIGYSGTSVWVYDTDYTDETAFTNAVSGQLLVYELETPTIIPITSATRVKTISGNNNIYSNTGDNSVKYFTDGSDPIVDIIEQVSYTKAQTDTEIEQAITTDTYSGLQTTNKTVVGAINECFGTWLTATLTAGSTSITLQATEITTTSTIDIYVSTFGIQPVNAVVSTGSITLTFLAQASDITVKVRVS